ncbi:MAG: hypothetical protein ACYTGP_09785 [Planctomycetota bacterium]|jgi:hypothetical protein
MTRRLLGTAAILAAALALPARGDLPFCSISFETGDCPPQCGATFTGGLGCLFEGLAFCYSGGLFSYKVNDANPLTITFSDDVNAIRTFWAHQGPTASGTMTFFDAVVGGNQVGSGLPTNGNCLALMPPTQTVNFTTPVRRIEVTSSGGVSWIDDFQVNPCLADLSLNGAVDFADILQIIGNWGPCGAFCPWDLNGNGSVDFADILVVISQFGPCP